MKKYMLAIVVEDGRLHTAVHRYTHSSVYLVFVHVFVFVFVFVYVYELVFV